MSILNPLKFRFQHFNHLQRQKLLYARRAYMPRLYSSSATAHPMPSATNMDAGVEVVRRAHHCRQHKANRAQLKLLFSSITLQTIRCEERDRASEHDETQKTEHDIQSFGNCAAFRDCTKRDKGIQKGCARRGDKQNILCYLFGGASLGFDIGFTTKIQCKASVHQIA